MKNKLVWIKIPQYIFLFFAASAAGFAWEVLIFLVKEGRFFNRGFFYGPWLPVYGTGAFFMYLLLHQQKRRPFRVFWLCLFLGSALELAAGWLLDRFWGLRYWDYTGALLNYKGYICLLSSLGFGIAGVLWICLLSGLLLKLWNRLPVNKQQLAAALLVIVFIVDLAAALIFPNAGRGVTF